MPKYVLNATLKTKDGLARAGQEVEMEEKEAAYLESKFRDPGSTLFKAVESKSRRGKQAL